MSGIGSTPALIVGTAVGGAAAAAFQPALEIPRQEAWQSAPNRLPEVGLLAELVAGGKISQGDGRAMAKRLGFDQGPFDSLTWLAQTRSDFPTLLRMWRLAAINPAFDEATLSELVNESLAHDGLDWKYQPYLRALKDAELIGIGDIAYGVVRGILPDEGMLPVPPPTSGTSVPRFKPSTLSPTQLAAALGYNKEQLRILVGRSGLSMAPGLAAQARFRKIINAADYTLAIAEGDLRTEWADPLFETSRQIPTAGEFMEGALRGWIPKTDGEDGAALHGMTQKHADLLYQIKRRPLNIHQITTGLARGGTFDATNAPFDDPYKSYVHEADLGPEWYDLAEANKYVYPSAFVLRSLAQSGDLGGEAAVEQVLLELGWKPSFAKQVATAWTTQGGAADTHTAKAQTQLWNTTHRSYIAHEISDATATTALEAAGVASGSVPAVLQLWQAERDLIRKSLSATQIRKAVSNGVTNPATGQPWTTAEALARLRELGYDHDDATTFLEEG